MSNTIIECPIEWKLLLLERRVAALERQAHEHGFQPIQPEPIKLEDLLPSAWKPGDPFPWPMPSAPE